MPNLEWEVPHSLVTPLGTLDLNVPDPVTFREYLIIPPYSIVPTLRVTQDNLSQADGSALHPRWKTGLVATLTVKYIVRAGTGSVDYEPACEGDLREMHDLLMSYLNALRRDDVVNEQRLIWTPSGEGYGVGFSGNRRMIDDIRLLSWPAPERVDDDGSSVVTFSVETPFPYAIDSIQEGTDIADGVTTTLTNDGSSEFRPVVKAFGPTTAFTVTNSTTGKVFSYDGSRPGVPAVIGSGDYAEIDFFRGTVTLNGDVTFLDAGVDPTVTDFWELAVGDNDVAADGADLTVLWNQAWS